MSDFGFLFTAWMVVWAVFFVYEISIATRIGHVKDEIQRLKEQLDGQKV
jgi:cell division protein FtsL